MLVVSGLGGLVCGLMLKYSLSHNLDLPDALIAATAIVSDLELYTLNLKHFKYIDDIKLWNNELE